MNYYGQNLAIGKQAFSRGKGSSLHHIQSYCSGWGWSAGRSPRAGRPQKLNWQQETGVKVGEGGCSGRHKVAVDTGNSARMEVVSPMVSVEWWWQCQRVAVADGNDVSSGPLCIKTTPDPSTTTTPYFHVHRASKPAPTFKTAHNLSTTATLYLHVVVPGLMSKWEILALTRPWFFFVLFLFRNIFRLTRPGTHSTLPRQRHTM